MRPITRIEKFLDGIINGTEVPTPLYRTETILNDIKNGVVTALTPITREEAFLAKISGANVQTPTPITRIEKFLAKKAGYDITVPRPIYRVEHWLNDWIVPSDPLNTFTGVIARFLCREAKPIVNLTANFTPIQDLNGYEAPWPPGGGANKLAPFTDGTYTNNGVTMTASGGQYTLSETSTGTWNFDNAIDLPAGSYAYAFFNDAVSAGSIYLMDASNNVILNAPITSANATGTFSIDVDAVKLRIRGTTGYTYNNVKLSPMIVSGSTVPTTFAPYSNECPISGHTGAEIDGTGKNLFEKTATDTTKGFAQNKYLYAPTGEELNTANYNASEYIRVEANTVYTLNPVTGNGTSAFFYDSSKAYISGIQYANNETVTFTTPNNTAYIRITIPKSTIDTLQLEIGSTASDYEAYSGTSVTINFGQTVYGGQLTVNEDGSGQLVADRAMDSALWSNCSGKTSLGNYTRAFFQLSNTPKDSTPSDLCNVAPFDNKWRDDALHFYCNKTNARAYVYLPNNTDGNLSISVCYELDTPITIPLTPGQIQTLVGTNTVWVNDATGDITVQAYGTEIV